MGIMLDSIRYRLYAVESETSEPSGTTARIKLEYRAGNITYGLELREPFGPGIVADEARSFDPGKPIAMPPVWLLVRGDATPERGLRCLTGRHHTGWRGCGRERACGGRGLISVRPSRGCAERRPVRLWVLRDLLDGGSQEC